MQCSSGIISMRMRKSELNMHGPVLTENEKARGYEDQIRSDQIRCMQRRQG